MKAEARRFLALLFSCLSVFAAQAQSERAHQIEFSGLYLSNTVIRFSDVDGVGYADNGKGFGFGFQYNRMISEKAAFNTGLKFLYMSNVCHGAYTGPMHTPIMETQETRIIQIPFRLKYEFLKWAYLKSGFTIDSQLNNKGGYHIDNQSGIGFSSVLGIALKVFDPIYIIVEPELGITSLIPFNRDRFQQHFIISGINFNLAYRF